MTTDSRYLLFQCTLLLFTVSCHGEGLFFNDNGKLQLPGYYNIAWMAGIQDSRTLSLVTIPGTHDSLALYGGPIAECQVWALRDQLRAGIRFLDLKVFELWDKLYVMKGVMHEHSTVREVLDTVQEFLSEFGSETVLIRLKSELFHKGRVDQMVQSLISKDKHVWVSSSMPTMGQVRGKIVFVQESTFTLGIALMDTASNSDKVTNIKDKDNTIINYLNQASLACADNAMPLTFSSGTGFGTFWSMFLTPKRVAEKVNPWLNQYLSQYSKSLTLCYGVIAMDFPGIDLIQTVININWW